MKRSTRLRCHRGTSVDVQHPTDTWYCLHMSSVRRFVKRISMAHRCVTSLVTWMVDDVDSEQFVINVLKFTITFPER